jgi:3-ketosteroid 9alpha-monooxygenase subunit B
MSKPGRVRDYYQVPVAEVIRETSEASSLVLDVPPALSGTFAYRPGQFITVRVPSDRTGSVARCYSLCSSPQAGDLPAITVKRKAGGYASNWLLDNVAAGAVLDLLPPAGTFCPRSLDGEFLLFAAGSGSTPIMSILKSVLAIGRGRVALVYANRDDQSVIFTRELRKIAAAAGGRLVVMHWLDSVQGIPTAAGLAALAEPYATWQPYICGPDPFLTVVRAALAQLGVPAKRIRAERFLSLAENPFEESPATSGLAASLTVDLDGATRVLPWPPGARMLDVLIGAGLTAPYSCRQGICGACACQLTAGRVEMAHNEVLEPADLADGYILACQSVPLTPDVSITY